MGIKSLSIDDIEGRAKKFRAIAKQYPSQQSFAICSGAEEFLKTNSLAPIVGTICDQQITAEDAWEFPYWLHEQLKQQEFSAQAICELGKLRIKELLQVYLEDKWPLGMLENDREKYLQGISSYIIDACNFIAKSFDNNPDNMFRQGNYNVPQIYFILRVLPGVGPKKASMIARDFAQATGSWYWGICERLGKLSGIEFKVNREYLSEVPVDVQVVKVFGRIMGEFRNTPPRVKFLNYWPDIQNLAKLTFPDFPGKLDQILWAVGREYCRERQPDCSECPLRTLPCNYANW